MNSTGQRMSDEERGAYNRCLMVFLAGFLIDLNGKVIEDDSFLACLNAHFEPVPFKLPPTNPDVKWEYVLDTSDENGFVNPATPKEIGETLAGRSLALFRLSFKNGADHAAGIKELLERISPPPPAAVAPPEAKPT
jgi:pullulanase/glycogen debranching enzyme